MILFKLMFYGFGLLLLLLELFQLSNVKENAVKLYNHEGWKSKNEANGVKYDWNNIPSEFSKFIIGTMVFVLSKLVWMGLGIFTYNWQYFIGYILFIIIVGKISNIKNRSLNAIKNRKAVWHVMNIMFYIFVIINSFHLHIKLF